MPLSSGRALQPVGKQGQLVVIPRNCTGCRTCELACSFAHSAGGVLARSRIAIHPQEPAGGVDRYVQVTCLQCAEAACAEACPMDALVRNEDTGAIEVTGRCVGCGLCEAACPFGHMHFDRALKVPVKCDLCGGRPACAAFCPHQALEIR